MANTTIVLENGIALDPEGGFARDATEYAARLDIRDVRVFLATDPEGKQEYLIVVGRQPVFASTQYEAICCRLDAMAKSQNIGED
jgi:hypothetical protein